jgi:hypothetical protein
MGGKPTLSRESGLTPRPRSGGIRAPRRRPISKHYRASGGGANAGEADLIQAGAAANALQAGPLPG